MEIVMLLIVALYIANSTVVIHRIDGRINELGNVINADDDYEMFQQETTGTIIMNNERVKVIAKFSGLYEIMREKDAFITLIPEEDIRLDLD